MLVGSELCIRERVSGGSVNGCSVAAIKPIMSGKLVSKRMIACGLSSTGVISVNWGSVNAKLAKTAAQAMMMAAGDFSYPHLTLQTSALGEIWEGDVEGRAAINAAFATFVSKLNECDGIEVDQNLSEVVSGDEFTWQETRATDEWNFANLSHRE